MRRGPSSTAAALLQVGALLAGLLLAGCGESPSRLLGALGIPHLEEVPPADVPGRIAAGAAVVQLDEPSLPAVPDAIRVARDDPLAGDLLELVNGGAPLLVLALEQEEALALGARLSRAGAVRVGIVIGEREELASLAGLVDGRPPVPGAASSTR